MPRLAVLMPVYNAESYLRQALGSTLRALPADSVLIAADDASTDNSARILQAAESHPQLIVIRSNENAGVAVSLNTLLQASDSEYIARMDADDICLPGRFRSQLAAFKQKHRDFVFTSAFEKRNHRLSLNPASLLGGDSYTVRCSLLLGNALVHSTMMARRACMDKLGGYRAVPSEDYDLWLRAATEGYNLQRSSRPGIIYRHHVGQVTKQHQWTGRKTHDPETLASYARLAAKILPNIDGMKLYSILNQRIALDGEYDAAIPRIYSKAMQDLVTSAPSLTARMALGRKLRRATAAPEPVRGVDR